MSFQILQQSIFDSPARAYVNTINCVGAMGAGIALEFKNRYPKMFEQYRKACAIGEIRPGDCYVYLNHADENYLLGLAVKDHWKNWGTVEWLESSLKSLKLEILENNIPSLNMPLPCAQNGNRGPDGPVVGFTCLPKDSRGLLNIVEYHLKRFADTHDIEINVCIPQK